MKTLSIIVLAVLVFIYYVIDSINNNKGQKGGAV